MIPKILHRITRRTASPARAPWKLAAATVGLALAATSAGAAIVAVLPDIVVFVPNDVRLNQTESDIRMIAFNERPCFSLNFDLVTDDGIIPKNTRMSSHFVHGDPDNTLLLNGRVRFDNTIIGVISTSTGLDASDGPCGRPGVVYPVAGAEPNRGLEPTTQADQYTIIAGGTGLEVDMEVPPASFSDQIRVLTRCCTGTACPATGQ
jgi:hypothetical protein